MKKRKTTHTPGPWVVTAQGSEYWLESAAGKLLGSVDWKEDQKKYPFTVSHREASYNALLIAAAPDLLEAVRALQRAFENYSAEFNPGRKIKKVCSWGALNTDLLMGSKAIAKAEGR